MTQAMYQYQGSISFKDGSWRTSTSTPASAPHIQHVLTNAEKLHSGIPQFHTTEWKNELYPWGSKVTLIEAEDAPALSMSLEPPQLLIDSPGVTAIITLHFGASTHTTSFSESGWKFEIDISAWFDSLHGRIVEDEAIGSEAHSVTRYLYGRVAKDIAGKRAILRCTVDVKDQYIATGYAVGVGCTLYVTLLRVRRRLRV